MNNKTLLGFAVIAVLCSVVLGLFLLQSVSLVLDRTAPAGLNITYSGSQGRIETYNLWVAMLADVTATRVPLAGVLSATGTWDPGAVVHSTTTHTSVSLAVEVSGAVVGDFVLVSLNSSTSTNSWVVTGVVSGAGTTTIHLAARPSATSIDISTTTYNIRVLPSASFAAPAALTVFTTSTP